MKKIVFLVISLMLFTGCYDYKDIDDLDIVNGIYIDYKDSKYVLSLEIVSSDNESTEVSSKFISFESKSLEEAFNDIKNNSSKELYLGNISVLGLSESISKMGIMEVLKILIRDVSINNNYVVLVISDMDSLRDIDVSNDCLSNVIFSTIENSYDNINNFMVEKVSSMVVNKIRSVSLPYLDIHDKKIDVSYMVYFNDDVYHGKVLNKVYKLFNSKRNDYLISNDKFDVTIYKCKIKYKLSNGVIRVIIKGMGVINNIEGYDLSNGDIYKDIEDIINDKLKKDIIDYINLDSNLVGLDYRYYIKYGSYNIRYEVISNIKINKNGSIIGDLDE